MIDAMRTTKDLRTGKPFRWNSDCIVQTDQGRFITPQRCTARVTTWLHPSRVPPKLLAQLNNGRTWQHT